MTYYFTYFNDKVIKTTCTSYTNGLSNNKIRIETYNKLNFWQWLCNKVRNLY